jgi:hypothetical protein
MMYIAEADNGHEKSAVFSTFAPAVIPEHQGLSGRLSQEAIHASHPH